MTVYVLEFSVPCGGPKFMSVHASREGAREYHNQKIWELSDKFPNIKYSSAKITEREVIEG